MYEHYQDNSPVGFGVIREEKGAVRRTAPSRTAVLFLLKEALRVEGKRFPDSAVRGSQMSPMPAGIGNSVCFMEDGLILVLYFISSKFKFRYSIIMGEIVESTPKRADWLFALGMIKPTVVLARRAADYVMDGLFRCGIQLSRQCKFMAAMRAYYSKDDLTPFLAPFYGVGLSLQDTIIAMSRTYPSVNEVTEKVCMSRPTFIRHFKQRSGEIPKVWASRIKGKALSKMLLNTSDTLEQIVNQFEFSLVQRFSTFYEETLDGTPGEIRNDVVKSGWALWYRSVEHVITYYRRASCKVNEFGV